MHVRDRILRTHCEGGETMGKSKKSVEEIISPTINADSIERWRGIARIHTESFNVFLEHYLPEIVKHLPQIEVDPMWYSRGIRPSSADSPLRGKGLYIYS